MAFGRALVSIHGFTRIFLVLHFASLIFLAFAGASRTEVRRSRNPGSTAAFRFLLSIRRVPSAVTLLLAHLAFHLPSHFHYAPPRRPGPLKKPRAAKAHGGPVEIKNHPSYVLSRGNVASSCLLTIAIRETVSSIPVHGAQPLSG